MPAEDLLVRQVLAEVPGAMGEESGFARRHHDHVEQVIPLAAGHVRHA